MTLDKAKIPYLHKNQHQVLDNAVEEAERNWSTEYRLISKTCFNNKSKTLNTVLPTINNTVSVKAHQCSFIMQTTWENIYRTVNLMHYHIYEYKYCTITPTTLKN